MKLNITNMKKLIIIIMVIAGIAGISGCSSDPSEWSEDKLNTWFEKGEWLEGWQAKPDASISRREFAVSYHKDPERWHKAFLFLKAHDLNTLQIRRYDIIGDTLYALVSEYPSKTEQEARFEVHQKYIDIQYVINGEENIGVAPLAARKETVVPYDQAKDIEFMTVTDSTYFKASPDNFFIFFPSQIHKPGMRLGSDSVMIKKVVVKVKAD